MANNKYKTLRWVLLFIISSSSSYYLLDNSKTASPKQLTFAIYSNSTNENHLAHVIKLLNVYGFERTNIKNDWNILWAHDYPYFKKELQLKNVKSNQIINHIPGCGFITNKVTLSTSGLPFLPVAFKLPEEKDKFLNYVSSKNNSLFVEKHNEHRNIKISDPDQINLDSNDSFVQEFIQKPLLVDGHKFDIGIYVLITSVNPLLVYKYNGDVLFRFCSEKYHPFEKSNINKYVVTDDYLPIWKVPSLKAYMTNYSGGMRSAFNAYLRSNGHNPSIIWNQVDSIIRETILANEKKIIPIVSQYKHRNFFDLIRFDMIIDETFKVYLMEANMSPNLSSEHFKENALLYDQILYSALNILGLKGILSNSKETIQELVSAEKNLAVGLETCAANDCHRTCNKEICGLCLPCLTGSQVDILRKAHREHLHNTDMVRLLPIPVNYGEDKITMQSQPLSAPNKWLLKWFEHKCIDNPAWCH